MSAAYYIAVESGDDAYAPAVDGKLLAAETDRLDEIAEQLGLRSLDDYLSASDDLLEDFGVDLGDIPDAEAWYPAREGAEWFERVADYVRSGKSGATNPGPLADELDAFRAVLERAAEAGERWHLVVDA